MELTEQYGMFSKSQHQVCLKGHRIHGEVHSRRSRGGQLHEESQKTNTRVQDCIDSDKNYDATTLKYHCPYQQALDLVQQYEKMGSFDLEDRHGGRIGSESARISQEELQNKKYLVMNGMKKEGQGIDDIP